MLPAGSHEITELLKAWGGGDEVALKQLTDRLYGELHQIARRYLKDERACNTLQTTALVNEAYLRLVDVKNVDWQHRAQFFAISAQIMRRILVDAARARGTHKRGNQFVKVDLDAASIIAPEADEAIVALDDVLRDFEKIAPRQTKVVEMLYFAGMTEQEVAQMLNVSSKTVQRDWRFAKAWLTHQLRRR